MKRIAIEFYKIVYALTKSSLLSFYSAVFYITTLNLISLYGMGLLLQGWIGASKYIEKVFKFPYYFIVIFVLLSLNFSMMPTMSNLGRERKKPIFYPSVVVYTLVSILLLFYIYYENKLD